MVHNNTYCHKIIPIAFFLKVVDLVGFTIKKKLIVEEINKSFHEVWRDLTRIRYYSRSESQTNRFGSAALLYGPKNLRFFPFGILLSICQSEHNRLCCAPFVV